ncbi:MAG TPA: hypothetical protein DDX19_05020 [Rhodopirellula baltica]|uniref:Dienelactone hydrolase domain-containing protein n=1 Tax=Rhodopirellula baltica (strain DSM 10527 / NCIMB 13988 / SH1) TaxID=243090 RepID=Q7USU9_RHOBA|nr:dienelactone hydrolase family protein [Rhodopirellula baltica]CAD73693.1 conserved hypothetical protein [Rhodopirellula baltica SH 1]HBE62123.1 hypothetical protein [Rhodopirellula baltica]
MIPSTFQTGTDSSRENIPWTFDEPASAYDRAVVIAYGSDGLVSPWKAEIENFAKKLAEAGILALTPDYFEVDPPTPHGSSEAAFTSILPRNEQWAQVLRDAVKAAKALPKVDDSKVGLVGLSLGGFLALQIRDSVNVLVEHYAPYRFPPNVDLGTETPLIGLGPNKNPALKAAIHHGKADALVPISLNASPIKADLIAEGATVTTTYYSGAGHGFQGTDADSATARKESLDDTIKFFADHL